MERHEVRLSKPSLQRLRAKATKCTDNRLIARYRIIVLSAQGWSRPRIAAAVGWNVASITKVRKRWLRDGEAGLIDKHEDNGPCKVTDDYAAKLRTVTRDRSTDWLPRSGPGSSVLIAGPAREWRNHAKPFSSTIPRPRFQKTEQNAT